MWLQSAIPKRVFRLTNVSISSGAKKLLGSPASHGKLARLRPATGWSVAHQCGTFFFTKNLEMNTNLAFITEKYVLSEIISLFSYRQRNISFLFPTNKIVCNKLRFIPGFHRGVMHPH
jgi:hypothetical protein